MPMPDAWRWTSSIAMAIPNVLAPQASSKRPLPMTQFSADERRFRQRFGYRRWVG